MTYREELIQAAAVIVAMVEDLDYGVADQTRFEGFNPTIMQNPIFRDIWKERTRQDLKWGPQHHNPFKWLAILMEEVGEATRAKLQETE